MNDEVLWLPPNGLPALANDGVHVWRCRLDAAADGTVQWLDTRELARLEAIHHPDQRRRYLASKAFVRRTLARYLGMEPGAIRFVLGPRGKPRLDRPSPPAPLPQAGEGGKALHFNLTHTGDLALLAVARREVGIDVERNRPVRNGIGIARRMWPPATAAELEALEEPARSARFLALWTRFEAQQKASGQGMFGQRGGDFAAPPHPGPLPGGEGAKLPSPAGGKGAGGEGSNLPSPPGRGVGGEGDPARGREAGEDRPPHTLSFHPDPDHIAALAWLAPVAPPQIVFLTTDPGP